jgi:nitrite reductase/ring-hydroxylating ferredoxin subunit
MTTTSTQDTFVRAASLAELRRLGRLVVAAGGHTLCLFADGDEVIATDNRCPHMGFPLHRGSLEDGILTCHWHHARFDLRSGGTLDQFADDLPVFPVALDGDDVLVDVGGPRDMSVHHARRLHAGLERNLPLVVAKASLGLLDADRSGALVVAEALDFGVARRGAGWGRGLTTLTCLARLAAHADPQERALALYHGAADVAAESAGGPPRLPIAALPDASDPTRLGRVFRRSVEVRDAEGAERALASAVAAGATPDELAGILLTAITDHRYVESGHALDFAVKALEALDLAGWDRAGAVLPALAGVADGERMEESNAWRHPIDLVALLEEAFAELPAALAAPRTALASRAELGETLLGDDPAATVRALLAALAGGSPPVEVASAVTFAAVRRIAQFGTSNEFGDWDTALHTFTFANAVEQGLRRTSAPGLVRGVFDAAASVYLDRFLNVPPARLPAPERVDPDAALAELPRLLDGQQAVDAAGALVGSALASGADPDRVVAVLVACLLRENRDFHTIQCVEAGVRQHLLLRGTEDAALPLVAAARYLAAHAPTTRAQHQTFAIARRLHRGEAVYEEGA